jgi:hypothetical protein
VNAWGEALPELASVNVHETYVDWLDTDTDQIGGGAEVVVAPVCDPDDVTAGLLSPSGGGGDGGTAAVGGDASSGGGDAGGVTVTTGIVVLSEMRGRAWLEE